MPGVLGRVWPVAVIGLLLGALSGCRSLPLISQAEAVDVVPAAAQRLNQPVRAQGRIIFSAAGQVWQWSDGASQAITQAGRRFEGPAWSPDGTQIAVSEIGDNHSDLVVLDTNGRRVRQLTDHWSHASVQDSSWGRRPAWHPDGDRIAYASDLYGTDMSLWWVPFGGGRAERLYTLELGSAGLDWPAWSPDGRRIAFTAYPPGFYSPSQIYVLTLASRAVIQLTELEGGAFDAAWSPDGSTIAFSGRVDGKSHLLAIEPDGGGLVRLTDGSADRAPTWSPDGSEIAYLSGSAGLFEVWAVRVRDGAVSEPRQLTSGKRADAASGVSWAP